MANLNKISLIGNVGNIQVKTFSNGDKVVNASLATTERYTARDGQKKENTDWHNLVFGGRQADFVEQYVGKGDTLYVEGPMRYRKYTASDGQERSIPEVRVVNVQILTSRHEAEQSARQEKPQDNPALKELLETASEDLPF